MKSEFNYINAEFDLYENDDDTYHFYITLLNEEDKNLANYKIPVNKFTTIDDIVNLNNIYLVGGNDFDSNKKEEIKNFILNNDEWCDYITNCLEKAKNEKINSNKNI